MNYLIIIFGDCERLGHTSVLLYIWKAQNIKVDYIGPIVKRFGKGTFQMQMDKQKNHFIGDMRILVRGLENKTMKRRIT